ncbi:MAG: SLC13 family permease [Chitinophagales bacterium]
MLQRKNILMLAGPLLGFLASYALFAAGNDPVMCKAAGVLVLMAWWWITESVNIFITSLMPVLLFPMLGIMDVKAVAPEYMKDVIFLYIGGFVLTFAIERWDLHKRISLNILLRFGNTPNRLLLGFSLSAYLISMWLNNTSTTLMMLPITLAVVDQLHGGDAKKRSGLSVALLLAITFASSIGGTATLIGTLPNMVMKDFYDKNFPDATPLSFTRWFLMALPMSLCMLAALYFILRFLFLRNSDHIRPDLSMCRTNLQELGRMGFEEKVIGWVFGFAVLLWFTIDDKTIGNLHIPGWKNLFPDPTFVNESYVAVVIACILLFFPSKNKRGENIVTWEEVKKIPIGIIFLFGGGFALAKGVVVSGLDKWIAGNMTALKDLPSWILIFILCLSTTLFSEFASNTATVNVFMVIMVPVVQILQLPPMLILFPITMAASYSFMLPVGTPPNTIVFGTEKVTARQMMRAGFWLDVAGAIIITGYMVLIGGGR